jgi:hypothetical protein
MAVWLFKLHGGQNTLTKKKNETETDTILTERYEQNGHNFLFKL